VRGKKLRSTRGEKFFTARNSGAESARDYYFFSLLMLGGLQQQKVLISSKKNPRKARSRLLGA
jgi:hypothetical protein